LNPRSVTLAREKPWWLCEDGHEWRSTVRRRIKGSDCPVCKKEIIKKTQKNYALESVTSGMSTPTDHRKNKRYNYQGTVLIKDPVLGQWLYAQMKNLSLGGMYFELEIPLNPGKTITIRLDNIPFKSVSKNYQSTVKWCKGISDDVFYYNYGVGVTFI
jgi:hypothetical protein